MSSQRIGGGSSQWNNYSQPAPRQPNNTPARPSSLRADFGPLSELRGTRQTVQYPQTLQAGMVNQSSIAWLDGYKGSTDAGERALAKAVVFAIGDSTLSLGNPESQNAGRALYGKHLQTGRGTVSILVNLKPLGDGTFDLKSAAMRDGADESRKVIITAPVNAGVSAQAQPNPTPQFPVQHSGTPAVGPSSQPLGPVAAPPQFSRQISTGINRVLAELTLWDRTEAQGQIENKLRSVPVNEQTALLIYLTTQLSGKTSDAKPAIIQNWAATATVDRAMEGGDMRTERERELQNALTEQNRNLAFSKPRDEILEMLPHATRRAAGRIDISRGDQFTSPLYSRVFSDRRGPVAAITDIRNLIEPLPARERYEAIKQWVPQ
jgi:hypothetical protein